MPFTYAADSYQELLDKLRDNRVAWDNTRTFAECRQAMSGVSGIDTAKLEALAGELSTFYVGNEEQMLEQLRLTTLAWPASDYGLTGPEWHGHFIAELADKQQFYATDRFAEPQQWSKVEVAAEALALTFHQDTGLMYDEENYYLPDGHTVVTVDSADPTRSQDADGNVYIRGKLQREAAGPENLREQHFDAEVRRWRRWSDDGGEFEHYHSEDGVWERRRKDEAGRDLWVRRHSAEKGWLRYDGRSDTWLDPAFNQWRPHAQVGTPVAPIAPAEEPAREPDLRLEDLEPELQQFLQRLYAMDPDHRNVPIRTVLELLAETED